uniref:Peptidase A1 domain-containing protein n=1 Tax=Rhabditophanes sp. KR3021 TaxID=114890 RepID=A0AC35TSI6_9BILA
MGQVQNYMSTHFENDRDGIKTTNINCSMTITTNSSVMLSFEAPASTTTNLPKTCGASCNKDYVTFMPIPSQPIMCNSALKTPDQRMITNDFTTRLHVSPPNVGFNCNEVPKMTVYNDINNAQGTEQIVADSGLTAIWLMNNKAAAFSTFSGQMTTNRFGSIIDTDGITAHGHFMHYAPSTQEWVTGKTQFFTLANNCILEFYADLQGSDANVIKIDSHPLSSLKFDKKPLSFFGNKYFHFQLNIKGYGLHSIKNKGKFISYIICKSVNGPNNTAGYLTSFNQWKNN